MAKMSRGEEKLVGHKAVHLREAGDRSGNRPSRATDLTQCFQKLRDAVATSTLTPDRHLESIFAAFLDSAVPAFSDWCIIDLIGENRMLQRSQVRHEHNDRLSKPDSVEESNIDALAKLVPNLSKMMADALKYGRSEEWPAQSEDQNPICIVIGLRVKDVPYGTVIFAAQSQEFGYRPDEIIAAQEIARTFALDIERTQLHQEAREAVRHTQRVASQLHQLIATSFTVTGLRNEQDILLSLANSTRDVFDAESAYLSLEMGPLSPIRAIAHRGKRARIIDEGDLARIAALPDVRLDTRSPWFKDDWLIAPVLVHRDQVLGVVAVERESDEEFSAEDKEVLTLLAQMTSTALSAAELNRAILRSEARWRVLVEAAPIGLVEADLQGQIEWWNHSAAKIFNWSTFIEGQAATAAVLPDDVAIRLNELWSEVLQNGPVTGREFEDVTVGNRKRDLMASAALLASDDAEAEHFLTLIDDVTDHRQMKAELRHAYQMEIRGQVASSVAHDFNNLLTLISGHAEILSQDLADNDHALPMVRDIQSTASRAAQLTAQMQTIGRTKAPEPVVVDPVAAIQSSAEVIERIVGVNIDVTWSFDADSGNVRVDADQFEQMILNLSINARDAMVNGGQLSISVRPIAVGAELSADLSVPIGDYVLVTVTDSGMGMDDETRIHCFDPFFTTKGPYFGTGLGLSSARRLAEESKGAIRCQSEVGRGTTFEVFLPVVNEVVLDEPVQVERKIRTRGSATILLVEDEEGIRRLMSQVLRRSGYQVLEAESGQRALERVQDFGGMIDLLLSDVIMPVMAGNELATTLQSEHPELRVLLVSGSEDSSVLTSLLPGTSAFLAKPFKPSELVDQVQELLSYPNASIT